MKDKDGRQIVLKVYDPCCVVMSVFESGDTCEDMMAIATFRVSVSDEKVSAGVEMPASDSLLDDFHEALASFVESYVSKTVKSRKPA